MIRRLERFLAGITLLIALVSVAVAQDSGLWAFNPNKVLNYAFAEATQTIVVGKGLSLDAAPGVSVYSNNPPHISSAKLLKLQVTEVLKGTGLFPGSEMLVVILPEVIRKSPGLEHNKLHKDFQKTGRWVESTGRNEESNQERPLVNIFKDFQKTGIWPADMPRYEEVYPELPLNEPRLFTLFPASFEDPSQSMLWVGIKELTQGAQFYGYAGSFSLSSDRQEVDTLKHYLNIGTIQDRNIRERQIVKYSLDLLRNRPSSNTVALGAVENILIAFPGFVSKTDIIASKRSYDESMSLLSEQELNELVQTGCDRTRALLVRSKLLSVIALLSNDLGRSIPVKPLLRVIEDPDDEIDIRQQAIIALRSVDNPEVHVSFEKLLRTQPRSDLETILWEDIKAAPMMKKLAQTK